MTHHIIPDSSEVTTAQPFDNQAAFHAAVEAFISDYPLAISLQLSSSDFKMDTPIHECLKMTQYVKYKKQQIEEKRLISVNWEIGLKLCITHAENQLSDDVSKAACLFMQLGENFLMSSMFISDPVETGTAFFRFETNIITRALEGAAIAVILPELEQEYQELINKKEELVKSVGDFSKVKENEMQRQGSVEKMRWMKKVPLLTYLFFLLDRDKLLQVENIGATIASIFVDNQYQDITNVTINKYLDKIKNQGTLPHGHGQIDELIEVLKNLDERV